MMETSRLLLLPWNTDDCESFRPIATDPRVMRYINGGTPWSNDQIQEFVDRQIRQQARLGFSMWKALDKASGELAGFCGIQPLVLDGVEETEIGWWLAPHFWGRGLATEAALCAAGYAFREAGLPRLIAIAQPANRGSTRVMEKIGMGYQRETTHKGFSVVVYAMTAPR
jgi:RimJ/RimL family protein N-acetyltransferase